jgi:dUTP pyrophosphatase
MMFRRIETRVVNPLLGDKIELPSYATEGSAAMDLRACIETSITLQPGARTLVKTGIAINMMDPGLVAIVASRSGLSLKHGVRVAQGIGVIDADYHGEIAVILTNDGTEPYEIIPGERIAQLMFQPVIQVTLQFVDNFSTTTDRGTGGFGSTGKS